MSAQLRAPHTLTDGIACWSSISFPTCCISSISFPQFCICTASVLLDCGSFRLLPSSKALRNAKLRARACSNSTTHGTTLRFSWRMHQSSSCVRMSLRTPSLGLCTMYAPSHFSLCFCDVAPACRLHRGCILFTSNPHVGLLGSLWVYVVSLLACLLAPRLSVSH